MNCTWLSDSGTDRSASAAARNAAYVPASSGRCRALLRVDRPVTDNLSGPGALLEELLLLDHPAVSVAAHVPRLGGAVPLAILALDRHCIAPVTARSMSCPQISRGLSLVCTIAN